MLTLQDLRDLRKELDREVAALNPTRVQELAERIGALDTPAAVKCLLNAHERLGGKLGKLESERGGHERKLAGYGKIQEEIQAWNAKVDEISGRGDAVPQNVRDEGDRLRARFSEFEKLRDEVRAVEDRILLVLRTADQIGSGLTAVRSPEAVDAVIKAASKGKAWTTRACACRVLAHTESDAALKALREHLTRGEKELGVLVAVLDALQIRDRWDEATLGTVAGLLAHKAWQVQHSAAMTLLASKSLAAVRPLIEALADAEGRLQDSIHKALVGITRVDKGLHAESWGVWYNRVKESLADGSYQPREDERIDPSGRTIGTGVKFYGIPVTSQNLVFVLDRSESMLEDSAYDAADEKIQWTGIKRKMPKALKTLKPEGRRKIDIARYQLKRVLWSLPDGARFNIVFYNHKVEAFSDRMVSLSASSRKKAFKFFGNIAPTGQTNLWAALQQAMKFCAGPGEEGKLDAKGADTIYLLSDGLPYPPEKVVPPGAIVPRFVRWNAQRKVVVHTIFVGSAKSRDYPAGTAFMQRLASETGGLFRKQD